MNTLRSQLNPEEQGFFERESKFETEINRYQLHCGRCGEKYFVDERTFGRVSARMLEDPTDYPFRCEDCEAQMGDWSQAR